MINYDAWKTTPPEEDDLYTCPVCGGLMDEQELKGYGQCFLCHDEPRNKRLAYERREP